MGMREEGPAKPPGILLRSTSERTEKTIPGTIFPWQHLPSAVTPPDEAVFRTTRNSTSCWINVIAHSALLFFAAFEFGHKALCTRSQQSRLGVGQQLVARVGNVEIAHG